MHRKRQIYEHKDLLCCFKRLSIISGKEFYKTIPLILERASQVRFIIVDDGEQREYLESLATSLGVSGNVNFLGWIPHDELPSYLTSSDIYVLTSLSDSTSENTPTS